MFTGLATFLASLFASNKVQDLAIDGIKKLGGLNEMTDKEKSEYVLRYMELTKTQSPVRRLIAFTLTALYSLVVVLWLLSAGVGYLVPYLPAQELSGAFKMFFESVIVQPFNIILAFYFAVGALDKFGKK